MKKLLLLPALLCGLLLFAQKDKKNKDKQTLSPEQSKQIMDQINFDTVALMREFAKDACQCIDSIKLRDRSSQDVTKDIAECIDKQVSPYQLTLKLMRDMKSGGVENNITINSDRSSSEYREYYFRLERWLRDSCQALENAVGSHNKESSKSMSEDVEAIDAYNNGIKAMRENDLQKASILFNRAVGIDPQFAFAWDNLGICYRRQNKLDEALAAYNKSLELDPKGLTPLHNIPVVYEYQKKYDEALAAYARLLEIYPDDPEGHYGSGRVYAYFKEDLEKALHEMCKAYIIYSTTNSPYRVDAEKNINYIYAKMKEAGKEARFYEILQEHGLNPKSK